MYHFDKSKSMYCWKDTVGRFAQKDEQLITMVRNTKSRV
jgi:hypothetical protein